MILTLFPPTWGLKNKPEGSNGSNGVLFAYYWTDHEYAAAIAAQEVREARFKAPFALAGAIAATIGYVLSPWPVEAAPLATLLGLLVVALTMKIPAIARRIEYLGQSVECVIRETHYGTGLAVSIPEAARQLSRYKQFKGWSASKIETALLKEIPQAREWAASNRRMIERAKEK